MANATAKQLSEVIGIKVDKLLDQLSAAGIKVAGADDPISDEDKQKLLESLRTSHGKIETDLSKKIILNRKSKSELKISNVSGRNATTKTINVEVRKKRTYVHPSEVAPDAKQRQPETEQAILTEAGDVVEAVGTATDPKFDQVARKSVAAAVKAAEEIRLITQKEREEEEKIAYAISLQEVEAAQKILLKKRAEETAVAVAEAALAAAARAAAVAVANEEKSGKHGKRGDNKSTRYGRKELHVKDGGKQGTRKQKFKKGQRQIRDVDNRHGFERPTAPVIRNVEISDSMTVGELAQKMAVKAGDVIKALMQMGSMSTVNQILDTDTATLIVEEMGHNVIAVVTEDDFENKLFENLAEASEDRVARPPVVTMMGHVDHGKTSLLDYIRKSRVTSGEAGGITQHIGAYHVTTNHGMITFLDTPGHVAFSAMRARGAQVTDIVVLVVAADDGVMPQTKEAIDHARAANVPLVIAVNKMDKENVDPDRVKSELAALEVIPEDWGGENMFIHVSAMTGEGVEKLLESILLQSELLELQTPNTGSAKGIVVEATLDKGRGPLATILVQSGELQKGQLLLAGTQYGRVRAMYDESSKAVNAAGPSIPVVVLGLSGVPNAGDEVFVVENERKAKEFAEAREAKIREAKLTNQHKSKLQGMFDAMTEGETSEVNVLIKADVQGSAEAIREALQKLSTDEVRANIITCGVGGLSESDINLASASSAMVVGFNVRADAAAKRAAEDRDVDIRYYSIIYEVIDIVKAAMSGMLAPEARENILGLATVKDVFSSPKFGDVAGSIVVDGVVRRGLPIRVLRDNVVIYEGELESLRRFKDAVEEVRMGTECGIAVKHYNDVRPGDQIEVFERVEIARSLD